MQTFKIHDEEFLKKVKAEAEEVGVDFNEFCLSLMENALQDHIYIRHGDVIARLPKPEIDKINHEKAIQFILALRDLAKKLYKLNANIEIPILYWIEWYQKVLKVSLEELQEAKEKPDE